MALIICPECGREISDQAPACPHCGKPMHTSNAPETYEPQPKPNRLPFIIVGFFVALAVTLFVSCPGEDAHHREVKFVGEKALRTMTADQGEIVRGLSALFGGKVVDLAVDNLLEVSNYGVVSIGRLSDPQHSSKSTIVSVGLLGKVFTASADQLVDKIQKTVMDKQNEAQQQLQTQIEEHVRESVREGINGVVGSAKEGLKESAKDLVKDIENDVAAGLGGEAGDDAPEDYGE